MRAAAWRRPLCIGHTDQVDQTQYTHWAACKRVHIKRLTVCRYQHVHSVCVHIKRHTVGRSTTGRIPAALVLIHQLPCLLFPSSSVQSLLDAWRAELARQPLSMSESEACGVLGITPQPNGVVPEEELKAAYRRREWFSNAESD